MNIHPSYKTITDFYSTWSLPQATLLLSTAIKAAQDEKISNRRSPSALLYFFERLEELLTAAFTLLGQKEKRQEAKLPKNENHWQLTGYKTYCGWAINNTPWHYLPRHLTQKEFLDPWKALQKIKRWQSLADWQAQLKDILHDALSPATIHDFMNGRQALSSWLLLHKLLEATHLIEVRAIHEDEDGPRPKWSADKQNNNLSAEESEHPKEAAAWAVIKEHLQIFGEEGTVKELWEMTKRSLTNENDETSARHRSDMILLYEELKKLLTAITLLHRQRCPQQPQPLLQQEEHNE